MLGAYEGLLLTLTHLLVVERSDSFLFIITEQIKINLFDVEISFAAN